MQWFEEPFEELSRREWASAVSREVFARDEARLAA
jgi:hypothetical protein